MKKGNDGESTLNPLGQDAKREKAGSTTFNKYNYQYHWAFCRMLDKYENGDEFAVFIEEHEDVTVANCLDASSVDFEFNQVKETSKKHTIKSLAATAKQKPNSLIEKLASSSCNKTFSERISQVNFVSTGGFNFDLHKSGITLEVIESGELSEDEVKQIEQCISSIEASEEFISKLAFVIPELPTKAFDYCVEGKISTLIGNMAPGFKYDSKSIYECVIRDLYRKGGNSFDYRDWDNALKKKSITSRDLDDVFALHMSRKPDESITSELNHILQHEYSLNAITRRKISAGFNRYYNKRLSSRDAATRSASNEITKYIKGFHTSFNSTIELEQSVRDAVSQECLNQFQSPEDFTGAFLYELLEGVEI